MTPQPTAKVGGQTFSWLFDIGASITCMTQASFNAAFPHNQPRRVQNSQHCTAASGDKPNSPGIYEIDLIIKGEKFTHPINIMDTLTNNIIGLILCTKTSTKIAGIEGDQIVAIKEQVLPALASMVITA